MGMGVNQTNAGAWIFFLVSLSALSSEAPLRRPYMVPDAALMAQIQDEYRRMPTSPRLPVRSGALPTKADVLDLLTYTPLERDQGNCGNCWIWGGTGLLEVALGAKGIKDRLSIQYFNAHLQSRFACDGGTLYLLATFLNTHKKAIPWSNVGAEFKDGAVNGYCTESLVRESDITDTPFYGIQRIDPIALEPSEGEGIVEIVKNCISQKKAVTLSYVTDFESENGFTQWWKTRDENALWLNAFEGNSLDPKTWGSHNVLIVGYDASDADPAQHHWIAVNSWGAPPNRPRGIFRIPMGMNYGAIYQYEGKVDYCYRFQYFDIQFEDRVPAPPKVEVMSSTLMPLAGFPLELWADVRGTPPMRYQWFKNGVALSGENRAQLKMPALMASDHLSSYTVQVTNPEGTALSRPLVAPVLGQNLLLNPGMEIAQDWTPHSTLGLPIWCIGPECAPMAHSGSGFALLGGASPQGGIETKASLVQTVQLPQTSGKLTFGMWMKSQTEDIQPDPPPGKDAITFKVLDPQGATLLTLERVDNTATHYLNWRFESFPFEVPPGSKLQIQALTEQDSQKATRFSLDDCALVIEPSPMGLEVFPDSQAYLAGQVARVSAQVMGTSQQEVEWTVDAGALEKPLTQGAMAENAWTLPMEKGVYTLYANLKENPLIKVKSLAQVVLPQDINLQLDASDGALLPGQTRTLTASGDAGGGVKWSCEPPLRLEGAGLSVQVSLPGTAPLATTHAKVRVESKLDARQFKEVAYTIHSMDLNGDGLFDVRDLLILGMEWNKDESSPANLKGSGRVDGTDLEAMIKVLK